MLLQGLFNDRAQSRPITSARVSVGLSWVPAIGVITIEHLCGCQSTETLAGVLAHMARQERLMLCDFRLEPECSTGMTEVAGGIARTDSVDLDESVVATPGAASFDENLHPDLRPHAWRLTVS